MTSLGSASSSEESGFCWLCRASRAASCLRARLGGRFSGGGAGGGSVGGEGVIERVGWVWRNCRVVR